ncbi:hypothetical protein BDN72DRAFT_865452 [Pluteus cervinus]|uniref:Uncharacterized protein n=1 Tax=Pluteus cervinus TaxID=181527 RepID=A0ACD3A0I1_9AGAR|nr:hypothetical protein BDN72DRAFT_865452 [Pluteus cervinus]
MPSAGFDDHELLSTTIEKLLRHLNKTIDPPPDLFHWPRRIAGHAPDVPEDLFSMEICKIVTLHLGCALRDPDFVEEKDPLSTDPDDVDPSFLFTSNAIRFDVRLVEGLIQAEDKTRLEQFRDVLVEIQICTVSSNRYKQVETFRALHPSYTFMADTLRVVLQHITHTFEFNPSPMVASRAKTVESYAEKIERRNKSYVDPSSEVTDFCGGRIITYTTGQLQTACDLVEKVFAVDWEDSDQNHPRTDRRSIGTKEFGYRAVHYVVIFDVARMTQTLPSDLVDEDVGRRLKGLQNARAEIQITTILAHAWGEITHSTSYKSSFTIPKELDREYAAISASLEQADKEFAEVQKDLMDYANTYGSHMSGEEHLRSFRLHYHLAGQDPTNSDLALITAKLANGLGKWKEAITILGPHSERDDPSLLCELGVALCQTSRPGSLDYAAGQHHLERAYVISPRNTYILLSLAETYDTDAKGDHITRGKYLQIAYEADPADPAVLCEYLQWQLFPSPISADPIISLMRPVILDAIARCDAQAKAGLNVPWAYYRKAFFHLLLGDTRDGDDSLAAYAEVLASKDERAIKACIRTLIQATKHLKSFKSVDGVEVLLLALQTVYNNANLEAKQHLKALLDDPQRHIPEPDSIGNWEEEWIIV